jgi:peptide-methionine (R)-S-oxide reductase
MELVSDILTWGERYLKLFDKGVYCCSRCFLPVYSSDDKWKGPCVWPSFRKSVDVNATLTRVVYPYNAYVCTVLEVYCGRCLLFIGHQFEDGIEKGDTHDAAGWRH